MTEARKSSELAGEGIGGRRDWVRPSVQQLSAGSAENQIGPSRDGISNPS
jgi:hypothetical protein